MPTIQRRGLPRKPQNFKLPHKAQRANQASSAEKSQRRAGDRKERFKTVLDGLPDGELT